MQARNKVEELIMKQPQYSRICRQQDNGTCDAPAGLPTVIYAQSATLDTLNGEVPSEVPTGESTYSLADKCALTRMPCFR